MGARIADGLLEVLRTEGVTRVFGNPGTTELPFLAALALAGDPRYVLGLQENAVVAMADGHARASGGVGVVNLHVAAGLANGMAALLNARRSRVPLVVTAGQQDRRHLDQDPMLAGDLPGLAATACKSAVEVHHAPDLPVVLRRAFRDARTPPEGPVLVSIPVDVLGEPLTEPVPPRSALAPPGVAGGVDEAAAALRAASRPAIVAGEGIGREDALGEAVALAEALGATVFLQPLYDRVPFPAAHRLVAGELPPSNAGIERALEGFDTVLVVGARVFAPHYYTQRRAIPDGVTLLQLDSDPSVVGRTHPVSVGLVGGIRPTLRALADALSGYRPVRAPAPAIAGGGPPDASGAILSPAAAVSAIAAALPADAVVAEEAVTSSTLLRAALRPSRPGAYHRTAGAALGWGLGAAVGMKLARPDLPVVAVVGDGSALYGLQALWTAAHERAATACVILDNREYRAVKHGLTRDGLDPALARAGADLTDPPIDWAAAAATFGATAIHAPDASAIEHALRTALQDGGPTLIHVPMTGSDAASAHRRP